MVLCLSNSRNVRDNELQNIFNNRIANHKINTIRFSIPQYDWTFPYDPMKQNSLELETKADAQMQSCLPCALSPLGSCLHHSL